MDVKCILRKQQIGGYNPTEIHRSMPRKAGTIWIIGRYTASAGVICPLDTTSRKRGTASSLKAVGVPS